MRSNMTCFRRKDVRELGMTLVINARKKPPPLHLYKALLMAQVKTVMLHAHARKKLMQRLWGVFGLLEKQAWGYSVLALCTVQIAL